VDPKVSLACSREPVNKSLSWARWIHSTPSYPVSLRSVLILSPHIRVACIVTEVRAGRLEFDSRLGQGCFLIATASRPALGLTQPPIQWVPGGFSPGVKRPGYKADHSPPYSAEIKNVWKYTSTPPYVFVVWCLVKKTEKLTFNFTFANVRSKWLVPNICTCCDPMWPSAVPLPARYL